MITFNVLPFFDPFSSPFPVFLLFSKAQMLSITNLQLVSSLGESDPRPLSQILVFRHL